MAGGDLGIDRDHWGQGGPVTGDPDRRRLRRAQEPAQLDDVAASPVWRHGAVAATTGLRVEAGVAADSMASGSGRGDRRLENLLEAVLAERRHVDQEIDPSGDSVFDCLV